MSTASSRFLDNGLCAIQREQQSYASMEITFGIELELLLALLPEHQTLQIIDDDGTLLKSQTTRLYIEREIRTLLSSLGFPVEPVDSIHGFDGAIITEPEDFTVWKVKNDGSIRRIAADRSVRWHNIELISPAFVNGVDAYGQIEAVVKCIKDSFRVHLNPSCGFHVHCGVGLLNDSLISISMLRRLGALLWSVDMMLSTLHPPERIFGYNIASIRLDSWLSRGHLLADAQSDVQMVMGA